MMETRWPERSKILSRHSSNRREFLRGAGIAIANVVAAPSLLAGIQKTDGQNFMGTRSGSGFPGSPAKEVQRAAQADTGQRKLRGLMVDAGRVPESMEYYRRVVEFCADWGLNTLHFRLADDQGSALRFASVPGLLNHRNAFTPEQLRSLAEYGQSHGVDVLPELESFGHTGFITRSPAYAHLLDRQTQGPSEFSGVIPVNPETLQLFDKLYREVAAIFPSTYLHGGCDEVNWGGSELSRKALQAKTRAQVWAEYLNSLNQISEGLGKQFIVWGDFVLHKEPEILGLLNKNIIVMDWNYYDNSSLRIGEALRKVSANSSRGIGAPALNCYRWGPRVGTEQLRNIDAYADSYFGTGDASSLGVILTNWIPSRYVQNSIWDGFAYAAIAFNEGTATAQTSAFRRFVERHYRAEWNEDWAEVFEIIYTGAPYVKERDTASWMGLTLPVPWSNDQQLSHLLRDPTPRPNPFTRLRSLLVVLEPLVLKNLSDFRAFQLCAEYLERMFWRDKVVIEQALRKPMERETAALLIQSIAERDQALEESLVKDWDKGRPADSAAKLEPVFGLEPKDQLLFQWERAAAYSAALASHPDRFYQLLESSKPG
jgi:Glycosyl hydrolase family 20, catalytic domain